MYQDEKDSIVTGNRAEYEVTQIPILEAIRNHLTSIIVFCFGCHLDPAYGHISEIEADSFKIHEQIDIGKGDTNLFSTSYAISKGISEITKCIEKHSPDIFIVYADRYESFVQYSLADKYHYSSCGRRRYYRGWCSR